MGVIYKITSPTSRVYVGKTYDLRKRINAHKTAVRGGSAVILHSSIRKYGWDAHVLEVIEQVEDERLNEREMFWISELKTYCHENPMGMNMTLGGDGQRSTWMHKTELRKRFSDRFSGAGNPFHGKKHSEESKRIIGEKTSKRNLEKEISIPAWGAEKGRLKVIRAVLCYDKYGNFLKQYDSLTSAEKELKVPHSSISESCNNIITGVFGRYIFRYAEPNYPLKIEVGEVKEKTVKRIVLYLDKRLGIIKEYSSALEASNDLDVPITTIRRSSYYNNYKPIRTGHIFIYKDLHEKLSKQIV